MVPLTSVPPIKNVAVFYLFLVSTSVLFNFRSSKLTLKGIFFGLRLLLVFAPNIVRIVVEPTVASQIVVSLGKYIIRIVKREKRRNQVNIIKMIKMDFLGFVCVWTSLFRHCVYGCTRKNVRIERIKSSYFARTVTVHGNLFKNYSNTLSFLYTQDNEWP